MLNTQKTTTHMVAYILKRLGKPTHRLKLIKLLYLSDRQSLKDTGYSISGDQFWAMKHGPVGSCALSMMRQKEQEDGNQYPEWFDFIDNGKTYLHSLKPEAPELSFLSKYDLSVMDRVLEKYGQIETFELCDLTHELKEWRVPVKSKRLRIRNSDILKAVGYSNDEALYYEKDAAALAAEQQILLQATS